MFNPPAALLTSRVMNRDVVRAPHAQPKPRAPQPVRALDDPVRDRFWTAPPEPPRRPWTPWAMLALIAPARRLR